MGAGQDFHQSPVGVLTMPGRDALGHDGAAGVLADVDHLGAGVGLLVVVDGRHRVELPDRAVTAQHAAGVFPGDRRAGLDLGPGDMRVAAAALAALGDEIVDAADAAFIARIPVLHGRVLDEGIVERHQFHDRGVQLVLIAHRRRAAFQIADVGIRVRDDQRALELPGIGRIDAEIGGQLHRATHALGNVDEGAVGEHRRIQRRVEIVRDRHHAAQILLDELRVLAYGLREGAEDDARGARAAP